MAIITPTFDRGIQKLGSPPFDSMRAAAGASLKPGANWGATIQYLNFADAAWQNIAFFLEFDTRNINVLPVSVTFNMYVYHLGTATPRPDFYVMRSYWASDGSIVTGDYQSWLKTSSGGSVDLANMHKYSSIQTPVDDTWFNITLDDQARQDMVDRDYFQIAVITDHEVDGVSAPNDGSAYNFSMYTADKSGYEPYLDYEPGTVPKLEILGGTTKILSGKVLIK